MRASKSLDAQSRYTALNAFVYTRALYQLILLQAVGVIDDQETRNIEAKLLRKTMSLSTKIDMAEFASLFQLKSISDTISRLALQTTDNQAGINEREQNA